jgi:hypothetical protein
MVHELGHNIGFQHSNVQNAFPTSGFVAGNFNEYGDHSCQMGVSFSNANNRRLFNALQLWRWGVIDAARTQLVPTTTSNFDGLLYATYYDEPAFSTPPTKIIKLNSDGGDQQKYYVAYRSPQVFFLFMLKIFFFINEHQKNRTGAEIGRPTNCSPGMCIRRCRLVWFCIIWKQVFLALM